jgi:structure-specific endonuclease subunit SLX1
MDTRFHCVYLLTSLDPQCEGDYYIGYTVNPLRRLRQHNGELVNGARRTSRRGRPWTIVCCVSGFTEDRAALKFEWCWQNPMESVRLKHTVGVLKGLRRLPYAVGTLHLLVRAPLFNQLDLTLHVFEPDLLREATAKVEVFLALRGGPETGRRQTPSPQRGRVEALQGSQQSYTAAECTGTRATPLASTQVLDGSSAYGSASSPVSLLLPPLEPSSLFHVEVLTRQAFEDAYLSHDRCLLLPSVGVACGCGVGVSRSGSNRFARAGEGEDSCLSAASCPYDVSALSQAARAEWSNASSDVEAERGESSDGGDSTAGAQNGADVPAFHTPSPDHRCPLCDTASLGRSDDSQEVVLGGLSEEHVEEGDDTRSADGAHRAGSSVSSASRSHSRVPPPNRLLPPSRVPVSSTDAGGCGCGYSSVTPTVSPLLARSPTVSFEALRDVVRDAAARSDARVAPSRIPLRFAQYNEADFARAHAEEQRRLHHGLLPCSLCALPLRPPCVAHCSRAPFCELRCHLSCLAMWMLYAEEASCAEGNEVAVHCTACREDHGSAVQVRSAVSTAASPSSPPAPPSAAVPFRRLIPSKPCPCPLCGVMLEWGTLIKTLKRRVVVEARLHAAQRRNAMEQRWQARLAQISGQCGGKAAMRRGYTWRKRHRPDEATTTSCSSVLPSTATSGTPPSSLLGGVSPTTTTALPSPRAGRSNKVHESYARPVPAAVQAPSVLSPNKAGAVSTAAAAAPVGSSLLSWTVFCEDDWLL